MMMRAASLVAAALLTVVLLLAALVTSLADTLTSPLTQLIPGLPGAPTAGSADIDCGLAGASTGGVAGFQPDQIANAATIVAVGKQLGVPPQGWVIALTAALAESGLHNLNHGDRDSLGLFQQRPSQGWGTPTQILNPTYAATQFYRHLLALPGWQQMSINDAAQAVQRSATPHTNAAHEPAARALATAVQHATCTTPHHPDTATNPAAGGDCARTPATNPIARVVIRYACAQLGKPYVWGGH
jgi:hypothetical protein